MSLQLYSFVTDDDVTSKKILQKGNLQRRVTLIPINKIKSHPLSQNVIDYAKSTVRIFYFSTAIRYLKNVSSLKYNVSTYIVGN